MTTIDRPCIRNCCIDPGPDRCLGCGRHIDDIVAWRDMTSDQRRAAMVKAADFIAGRLKA